MPVSKLQNQVAKHIENYLSKKILVAVSGGRDSVVLLHLLTQILPVEQLIVVHVNHQLRGDESDADAKLVSKLAEFYGCIYIEHVCDVSQSSEKEKVSIETAARKARHQFFAQVQAKYKAAAVLLAHHADDQAETILFNLLRGSVGLKGMNLMQKIQVDVDGELLDLNLLRPLLKVRRCVIKDYQKHHHLAYAEDSSNNELIYTRNRLRHEAIPLLVDVMQRDVVNKILDSYDLACEELAEEDDLHVYLDKDDRLVISELIKLSQLEQRKIIKLYLQDQGVVNLSAKLILAAVDLLTNLEKPSINLPKNAKLRRKEKRVWVEKN